MVKMARASHKCYDDIKDVEITADFVDEVFLELNEMGDFDAIFAQSNYEHANFGCYDARNVLINILRCLVVLCGSEEGAIQWLTGTGEYEDITGKNPALHIKNGNFWTLAYLFDWLLILVRYRKSSPKLIQDIFRKPRKPQWSGSEADRRRHCNCNRSNRFSV